MSKTDISNNALMRFFFSADRHTTLGQGVLESVSFPKSAGVYTSRASKLPQGVASLSALVLTSQFLTSLYGTFSSLP